MHSPSAPFVGVWTEEQKVTNSSTGGQEQSPILLEGLS